MYMMASCRIIRVILLSVSLVMLCENNLRTSHASNASPKQHDQVMITTLLPITSSSGNIYENYVILAEALAYEVNNINKRQDILPTIELVYEVIDTKGENLHLIMAQAIEIVSKHRPRSVCRSDEVFCTKDFTSDLYQPKPRVSAVIGPTSSAATVPVASLLGLYNIPVIGYSASSRLLSDKSRFKSFLRTIPSDNFQAEAMASFIKYFGWNYVFFLGNDDEYGREGLSAFKNAIRDRKVCTANDVNIAFEKNHDEVASQVRKAVKTIAQEADRIQIVILFMFESQAALVMKEADKQGLKNITWIFSDGVGASIFNEIRKELADGVISLDFVSKEIPDFQKHLKGLTVKSSRNNSRLTQLAEEKLNCSIFAATSVKRKCEDNEKLHLSLDPTSERWGSIVNIINCVKAFAHGLDRLMKCEEVSKVDGSCLNKTLPVNGKDLYQAIKNASFIGAMNKTVAFDKDGDLATKKYNFRNYFYDRTTGTLHYRLVATWSNTSPKEPHFLNQVTWKGRVKPQATCSPVCVPGQKKVGQSDCCWACHPCPKGEISNQTSASNCTKCPANHYANEKRTRCIRIGVEYVEASDPFSVVIIVISCLGLVGLLAVSLLLLKVKDSPLVQDSDETLLSFFVLSNILAFIFPIFQVSLYRNDDVCRFLSALLLYTLLLVATILLVKTKTCSSHLRKLLAYFKFMKPDAQRYNLITIVSLLLFELLLLGVWYLTDSPVVMTIEQTKSVYLRQCSASWSAVRLIAYGFPLLVLFLATIFAFKERNSRENHSEAKYISFCTIAMCILLIAFFPTYRFVKGATTSIVIATTSLVGAFAVTGCILLPKVYILLFRPERNVPGGSDGSNEPTVSSAHTAGSHHGSLNNHYGAKRPNDIELTSSQSSASPQPGKDAANKDLGVKL